MKKILSLLFITSILLSACSANPTSTPEVSSTQSGEETPQPESTAGATESRLEVNEEALNGLEIDVWTPWYGIESSLFDTFVKEFNAQNEWGIVVKTQSHTNFTNLYEAVTASLATADKPDLVIALPEHGLEWYAGGAVTDLTPYTEDPKYGIDSSDIPFVFWNQDITSQTRVGVPAQRTAKFLLWNETWASELGFSAPPGTTENFRGQACGANKSMLKDDLTENDAIGGWIVDTEPMTAYAWLLAFQGGIAEGNGYRFLTPNNIEAFTFLRQLSETSCAWQAISTEPSDAFANRQALFITASLEDLPTVARAFASANNSDTWKVIPFPDQTLVVYGSSYIVLESTDEEQLAAWLFVRWLLDNEQDARWVEATHRFPLHPSTMDLLGDYKKTRPQWAEAVELLPFGELQPQATSWRTVKVMLGDGFTHMYRINVPSGQVAAILAQMESLAKDLNE